MVSGRCIPSSLALVVVGAAAVAVVVVVVVVLVDVAGNVVAVVGGCRQMVGKEVSQASPPAARVPGPAIRTRPAAAALAEWQVEEHRGL